MARVSPSSLPEKDAAPARVARDRSTIRLLLISLRPEQWTKNLLVLAGVVFGGRLMEAPAVESALAAFAIFCALSGAVYLVNDVVDR
jgi:4-hydroxybenzoate polyprenyltransferase